MKIWSKILIGVLSILFIISFFVSSGLLMGIFEHESFGFLIGLLALLINAFIFSLIIIILKRNYDDCYQDSIKIYFYFMFAFSIVANFYTAPMNYGIIGIIVYAFIYYIIIKFYLFFINRYFGSIVIKIMRSTNGIYVSDINSWQADLKVYNEKNNQKNTKSLLKVNDKITIVKNNQEVLKLSVKEINNHK